MSRHEFVIIDLISGYTFDLKTREKPNVYRTKVKFKPGTSVLTGLQAYGALEGPVYCVDGK